MMMKLKIKIRRFDKIWIMIWIMTWVQERIKKCCNFFDDPPWSLLPAAAPETFLWAAGLFGMRSNRRPPPSPPHRRPRIPSRRPSRPSVNICCRPCPSTFSKCASTRTNCLFVLHRLGCFLFSTIAGITRECCLSSAWTCAAYEAIHFSVSWFLMIVQVDYPHRQQRFEINYNLLSIAYNARLRVKTYADECSPVPSSCEVYPGNNWFERYIFTLLLVFLLGFHHVMYSKWMLWYVRGCVWGSSGSPSNSYRLWIWGLPTAKR